MTRAMILGAGRVGQAIAMDLAAESGWAVTVADADAAALKRTAHRAPVQVTQADLADADALRAAMADQTLIIGALPSFLGFQTLEVVLLAGKNYVDISFLNEDPFALDALARENDCTAAIDCGIAPGVDNLILGYLDTQFDEIESFVCYVGGLPVERTWPWEYKAPFAPYDVIALYTRPARYVAHGEVVTMPALSEPELIDLPGVGTLEAFNTDGLRSLIRTMPSIPHMKEMTLRYPGHAEKMRMLREAGFFDSEKIAVEGVHVSPLALTSQLLFDQWRLDDGEQELTVMRATVEGVRDGVRERRIFDLLDRTDPESGLSSMARTTGFTCAAVARLVANGTFQRPGVSAPEHIGQSAGCFVAVRDDLKKRGIDLRESVQTL